MTQVELAHMTWRDAEAARTRGAVVLIPIGTQEQNGPICPLASDTLAAYEVAVRVARVTGSVVAPSINYGYSPMFRHFPGTVSVRPETLRLMIVDVCENLIQNGFQHLLLVNCHLGNDPIMLHAAEEIRERLGILIGSFNPITLAQTASKDLYAGKESTLGHGTEPIASMLRAFTPESVHLESAQLGGWKEFQGLPVAASAQVKLKGAKFGLYFHNRNVMDTGCTGDPSASDPERGAEILDRVVGLAAEYVRNFSGLQVKES